MVDATNTGSNRWSKVYLEGVRWEVWWEPAKKSNAPEVLTARSMNMLYVSSLPSKRYQTIMPLIQLSNLLLINGIVALVDDFDLRLHHRSQMESSGLQRILELCANFGVPSIDKQIKKLQSLFDDDEKTLRERLDQEILRDLTNPQDVFNAIFSKTKGTRAQNYFLSMMQHLLLIREEGQPMVHYYQLLDSIVTDVVLDKKLAGAEQRMGHSVERIIAQFNEADRYQVAEDEVAQARALAVRLKLEKEALEEEISQGQDGLTGKLKAQISNLEEKLLVSRETTSRLHGQMEKQKVSYEDRINQLEAQIMELFRMLKEVGKGVETILDNGATMDRKALVDTLERTFQRRKTISILEGKEGPNRRRRRGSKGNGPEEEEEDTDSTPRKGSTKQGQATVTSGKKLFQGPSGEKIFIDENGRVSQFMDADDADAREQVQQQLVAGVKLVRHFFRATLQLLILVNSIHHRLGQYLVLEVSADRLIARNELPWAVIQSGTIMY